MSSLCGPLGACWGLGRLPPPGKNESPALHGAFRCFRLVRRTLTAHGYGRISRRRREWGDSTFETQWASVVCRFGKTCREARRSTRSHGVFKPLVYESFQNPILPDKAQPIQIAYVRRFHQHATSVIHGPLSAARNGAKMCRNLDASAILLRILRRSIFCSVSSNRYPRWMGKAHGGNVGRAEGQRLVHLILGRKAARDRHMREFHAFRGQLVEDAVVAGRDFGERDEFFRGLVLVGRVDEPRRNAARLPPCTGPRFLP